MQSSDLNLARVRRIAQLAIPISAGMISQNILNLVDAAMVGQLGVKEQAAVGLSGMLLWVLTAMLQGFSPAIQAITARRLGEKANDQLHVAMINAIYFIVLFSIPFTLLLYATIDDILHFLNDDPDVQQASYDYLFVRLFTIAIIGLNFCFRGYFNALHKVKVYTAVLVVMHVLNIVLNYGLIFGNLGMPELGVKGAALGTAIATTLGTICFLVLTLVIRNPGFSAMPKVVTLNTLKKIFNLALPNCFQSVLLAAGYLTFFTIAGWISAQALASTYILVNLNLVCLLGSMGLGIALITLVGNALGENKPQEAVSAMNATMVLATLVMAVVGLGLIVFPQFWLQIFTNDPEVIAMATVPLILVGISQVYDSAGIVLSYAHLGGGASKTVLVINLVCQWGIFIPACWVWVSFFDGTLLSIWICSVLYRFILFVCFFISIRRGKWLENSF